MDAQQKKGMRALARRGGRARARKLSAARRRAIARLGGLAGGRGRRRPAAQPVLTGEIRARLAALAPSVRETWYLPKKYLRPASAAAARVLLEAIMKHGTLDQYRVAGGLLRELEG